MVLAVNLPVIRIALHDDPLTWNILLKAKRAQAGHLGRLRIERPSLCEMALSIRFFQQMLWQHCESVEQSFRRRIGTRQCETHRVRIEFSNSDRLAVNNQQIALRRIHGRSPVTVEREK